MRRPSPDVVVPLRRPFFRGHRRLHIALVGAHGAGAQTLFRAVLPAKLPSEGGRECDLDVGFDQARVLLGGDPRQADVVIQVLDATALASQLELSLELMRLGRPLVLAINKMDAARAAGLHIASGVLARRLGVPVVPTIGTMGYGIRQLFSVATAEARRAVPAAAPSESAAALAEIAARPGGVANRHDWRYWLDELFLSPRFGLAGSAAVFFLVLYVVFDLSVRIDAVTTVPLAQWVSTWTPQTAPQVVLRAAADGLVGLVGIVVPYMVPLVLLLVTLEQVGIMARIGFAADRVFHRIGLHGNVALPLLLGLGCNVPALAALAGATRARERLLGSLLVTFVPCSARSAIILALAGKYLGATGVVAVFAVSAFVVAGLGRLLQRWLPGGAAGHIPEIPGYAAPRWRALAGETWLRSKEILTLVTPLLVAGSVALALLEHAGAAQAIDALLSPVTSGWLGLPAALGMPLVFGVLRKELSLAMVYQALGGLDVGGQLDSVQIFTFLVFLTLYVPCVSTFAVLVRTVGLRLALASAGLSVGVALAVSGAARLALEALSA